MFPLDSYILIVDDSESIRTVVRDELNALGYTQVIEAVDGREGLTKLITSFESKKPVSLVISDWNMPNMSGLEFLKKVRATWGPIPFILLTSQNDIPHIAEAIEAGVNNYIIKPLQKGTLAKKLDAVFRKVKG